MHRIALAAAALSLALAPAAFADDMASGSAPAQINSGSGSGQMNAAPAPMKKPHAIHYRSTSAAPLAIGKRSQTEMREQRQTRAMNLIGAAGYSDFSDLKPDGSNFRATAIKGDQRVSVVIDPKSGNVTPQ